MKRVFASEWRVEIASMNVLARKTTAKPETALNRAPRAGN